MYNVPPCRRPERRSKTTLETAHIGDVMCDPLDKLVHSRQTVEERSRLFYEKKEIWCLNKIGWTIMAGGSKNIRVVIKESQKERLKNQGG